MIHYFREFPSLIRNRKSNLRLLVALLVTVLGINFIQFATPTQAASYTWDGGGADNNWSTCANWSTNICPVAADSVTFNATSTKNAVIDAAWGGTLANLNITSAYSGAITLERSFTLTGFTQAGGTFSAGSHTLDMNGAFTLSGGTFTASSGTTTLAGAMTISAGANFNHNSGTFTFDGVTTAVLACANKSFNLVSFAHTTSRNKTISSDCSFNVGNNPMLGGDNAADITVNGTLSGTGTLQIGTAGAGNLLALNSGGQLVGFSGLTAGAVTTTNYTADFSSYSPFTLNGAYSQTGGVISIPNGADFNNAFAIDSTATFNAPSGNASFATTFTIGVGAAFNAGSGTITFDGSAGVITCNDAVFNHVIFSGGNVVKTVSNGCTMPLGNDPVLNSRVNLSGTLTGSGTVTSNQTVGFFSGGTPNGFSGWIANNNFGISGGNVDFSDYTTVDINGFFGFNNGIFTAPSGTMTVSNNFLESSFSGTFNPNGGTVVFDGNNIQQFINSSVTFHNLTVTTPSQLTFAEGHTTTVEGNLLLQGSSSQYLLLTSRTPGTQWQIDPLGTVSVEHVSVTDSNNINSSPIMAAHSEDGGNNINWEFDQPWRNISHRPDLRQTLNSDGLRHMDPRLIKLADGRLAIVYATNAGTVAGSQVQYSSDLGATWTSPTELLPDDRPLAMNVLEDGTVLAFMVRTDSGNMETWVRRSTDNMQTWSPAELIEFNIPGNPAVGHFSSPAAPAVELTNGDLLLPLTHRYDRGTGWVISHDKGITWEFGGLWTPVPDEGPEFNEPWVDYLDDGSLMVIIRSNTGNDRWIARSYDNGSTWTTPAFAFGGGASGGGLPSWIQLDSGVVVVFNRGLGQRWSYRISRDRGATWNEQIYFDTNRMQYGTPLEVAPGQLAFAYAVSTNGAESGPQNIYFNYFVDRSDAAITTTSLPSATVGSGYSQEVATSGTQGTKTFSISAGSLPPGLTLNPTSGQINGTPTQSGTFGFTVSVNDTGTFNTALGTIETTPDTASSTYQLTVNAIVSGGGSSTAHGGAPHTNIAMNSILNEPANNELPAEIPSTDETARSLDNESPNDGDEQPVKKIGWTWLPWLVTGGGLGTLLILLGLRRRREQSDQPS